MNYRNWERNQFFFSVQARASRIDSGNRVLDSKVGNRNRILEPSIPIPVKKSSFSRKMHWFGVNWIKICPASLLMRPKLMQFIFHWQLFATTNMECLCVHHYLNQQICNRLKGCVCLLPWHAIPFLKGLGMPNVNPCQNGWPRLRRSCNWQRTLNLIIQCLRRSPPYR